MASQVGTPVSGTDVNGVSTVSSPAKSVTSGNLLISVVKIETASRTFSGVTDTAGNTWTIINQSDYAGGGGRHGIAYAYCTASHASNVVAWAISGGNADFCSCSQDEWSGLATSNVLDGSFVSNSGTTKPWTTADITTTGPGLIYMGVSLFNAYSALSGTPGNPDFTANTLVAEVATGYLISSSAQTVTPGLTATGPDDNWRGSAQAFLDVGILIIPSTGSKVITGYQPNVLLQLPANTAFQQNAFQDNAFQILGGSTTGGVTLIPGTNSKVLTGFAPTIKRTAIIQPGVQAKTLTGFAPAVKRSIIIQPALNAKIITGFAPTTLRQIKVVPATNGKVITGFAPTVFREVKLSPSTGSLVKTGFTPTLNVSGNVVLVPGTASLLKTSFAPTLTKQIVITPSVGSIVKTGFAPTLKQQFVFAPIVALLSKQGFVPTLKSQFVITPSTGQLIKTGRTPTVTISGGGGGTPVDIYSGISHPVGVYDNDTRGTSKVHTKLTPVGGGNYTVDIQTTISQDNEDSPNEEWYVIH